MSLKKQTQKLPPKSLPKLNLTLNHEQQIAEEVIKNNVITVLNGKAGTGKTLVAIKYALDALHSCQIDKIIVTRPVVEAGENVGFLPGDIDDKLEPYMIPIYDNFIKLYDKRDASGKTVIDKYKAEQKLEIAPVAFMRGRTFDRAVVILDESQNTTIEQIKMVLTRIGKGSKLIVCGDVGQCDLRSTSGMKYLEKLATHVPVLVPGLNIVTLYENHRDPIVKLMMDAFDVIDNEIKKS